MIRPATSVGVEQYCRVNSFVMTFTKGIIGETVLDGICTVLHLCNSDIEPDASFLSLGGDSLTATSLSIFCKKRGFSLSVPTILQHQDIHTLFKCVKPIRSKRSFAENSSDHAASLQAWDTRPPKRARATKSTASLTSPSLVHTTGSLQHGGLILTEMQLVLIHSNRISPGSNVINFIEVYPSKEVRVMREAWNTVISTEPIFRIYGSVHDGTETIAMHTTAQVRWVEVVTHDQDEYNAQINKCPQHSSIGTSFKIVTLDQGLEESRMSAIIWRIHHALIDGWSASNVYQKVRRVAEGQRIQAGRPFWKVAMDLITLQGRLSHTCKDFWLQQRLQFPSPASELVLPLPKHVDSDTLCCRTSKSISLYPPLDEINSYVRNQGITQAALYYGAWALVLSKYTDSDTVMFGMVTSGRDLPLDGADDTIGPLMNTLPLNVIIDGKQASQAFLRAIFRQMIMLGSMQCSTPADGFSRAFASIITREFEFKYIEPARVQPIHRNRFNLVSDVPLSIFILNDGNIRLCYHSDKYRSSNMESLCGDFQEAISALLKPHTTLQHCLEMMVMPRRQGLLDLGNCNSPRTLSSSINKLDLVTLFESVASHYPTAIALQKRNDLVTYSKLDALANRVAQKLRSLVAPGERVCVHADRSLYWIVAIYGILKAGAVYVPLDPSAPAAVRDANFRTVRGKVFLAPRIRDHSFLPASCSHFFSVEHIIRQKHLTRVGITGLPFTKTAIPNPPAYICFTSGSTGKPKAVLCTHEGLVAFQMDEEVRLFARPGIKISQIMSPSFDGSIHEIFSTLSYGATLVLADPAHPFGHLSSVDSAVLTPSLANVLDPSDYPNLQYVYLVGEPVPQLTNDVWAAQKVVYNMYGPTEATCGATIKRLHVGIPVSLGRPNPSMRVYILDRHLRLSPLCVTGEIFLAGVQVAKEYVGNPKETESCFLNDLVWLNRGERMYRTGDVGYWDASGELVCLGRRDRQIKLSGFRLDLNDIEARILNALPEATAAAVIRKEDCLVAMVQPASLDGRNLRQKISEFLPPYALPRSILAQDVLPLTPTGKLDYAAIACAVDNSAGSNPQALRTLTETIVADAWREVLKIGPQVLLDGSSEFVALGGDSVLQLTLADYLSRRLDRRISIKLVFTSPRLRDLAQAIDQSCADKCCHIAVTAVPADLGKPGVSPMEHEWWQQYQIRVGTSSFNVSSIWKLDPTKVDRQRLLQAWNIVIARHKVLQSRFIDGPTGLEREYGLRLPLARLSRRINLRKSVNRAFKLDRDHLILVVISKNHMLINISHVICDLTSLDTLLDEVGVQHAGKPLPSSIQAYTGDSCSSGEISHSNTVFWPEYLNGIGVGNCMTDKSTKRTNYAGTSHAICLPSSLVRKLTGFSRAQSFTLHQIALSAVALASTAFESGSSSSSLEPLDFVAGSPYFNRQPAHQSTVGLFLSPLPIRIQFRACGSSSSNSFISAVQRSSQNAVAHAISWPELVKLLAITTQYPNYALFNTMVTVHCNRDGDATTPLNIDGCEQLLSWADGAKFRLMCEFNVLNDDCCVLRLEYDAEAFDRHEISRVGGLIIASLEGLIGNEGYEELRMRLLRLAAGEGDLDLGKRVHFGTPIASLLKTSAIDC